MVHACIGMQVSDHLAARAWAPDPGNAGVDPQLRVHGMQDNEALLENRTMYMLKAIPNASNYLGFLIEGT